MARQFPKPRPMRLQRNADIAIHLDAVAECDQWEVKLDECDKTYQCGRTVRVPAVIFDEADAKTIRRLAAWLEEAAAWVESKPLAAKNR